MTTLVRNTLVAGVLIFGTDSLIAAEQDNSWTEQWFKVKYGRTLPSDDANTAYRQVTTSPSEPAPLTYMADLFREKYGRTTLPWEDASTAYRQQSTPRSDPAPLNYMENLFMEKYGRSLPASAQR